MLIDPKTYLIPSPKHLTCLMHLRLSYFALGHLGGESLFTALQHLTDSQRLDLTSNELAMDATGVQAVHPDLKHLVDLQRLDLSMNHLDVLIWCKIFFSFSQTAH